MEEEAVGLIAIGVVLLTIAEDGITGEVGMTGEDGQIVLLGVMVEVFSIAVSQCLNTLLTINN